MRNSIKSIMFVGTSTKDVRLQPHIQTRFIEEGVVCRDPITGAEVFVPTERAPRPGGKVTARHPLDVEMFRGMIGKQISGGGAMNQAIALAHIARDHNLPLNIELIDSGPETALARQRCGAAGVGLLALDRHNLLVNLVLDFAGDKVVVRSPVTPHAVSARTAADGALRAMARQSDVVVGVSPKDPRTAGAAWRAARSGNRYLQPTGSLNRDQVAPIAKVADFLAMNVNEFTDFAAMLGVESRSVDEASPEAPDVVGRLLTLLRNRQFVNCHAVAVTRGRHGCLVGDLLQDCIHSIEIEVFDGPGVPTINGAGDFWHSAWIFEHEVAGLDEPLAAATATALTAEHLGLARDAFRLRVVSVAMPPARVSVRDGQTLTSH